MAEEHNHSHFCLCFFAKAQDWIKDRFYDRETHRYRHPWLVYVVVGLYLLHWLWHIAVGAAVCSYIYHLFD